jgi:nucleoside-diphosphate-sugar epimerase
MNVVITGATGFIGTTLVAKLLKDGNKVIIVTRDKDKASSILKGKVEVLEADIGVLASLEKIDLASRNIDVIFHLAAALNYFGDKRKLFKANVEGTVNLFNWAEKNGIKKFIFASSIEAMGTMEEEGIPANENSVCRPVSTYGESKLEAEKHLQWFAREKNLNVAILRLGNVYGLGSPAFIVPIANAILKRGVLLEFLSVYKNRYLHFVYIDDIIDGILKAAEKNSRLETYILAGEKYVTIGELFGLIAQILNVDLQVEQKNIKDVLYLNLRKKIHRLRKKADLLTYFIAGEKQKIHRAYSIEKAKKELGYSPKISLRDGLGITLEWAGKEGLLTK